MQISMNQGTGLSERNWLTEGCHLCAWKMMDLICKLLFYPTDPPPPHTWTHWPASSPSPPLVIKQGSKPMTLLANNKRCGKIGTLLAISSDCQEAHRGPVRFQWWQDRLTSWTLFFIFLSFFHTILQGHRQNETNISEPTNTQAELQNIWFCVLDSTIYCFFPLCLI